MCLCNIRGVLGLNSLVEFTSETTFLLFSFTMLLFFMLCKIIWLILALSSFLILAFKALNFPLNKHYSNYIQQIIIQFEVFSNLPYALFFYPLVNKNHVPKFQLFGDFLDKFILLISNLILLWKASVLEDFNLLKSTETCFMDHTAFCLCEQYRIHLKIIIFYSCWT